MTCVSCGSDGPKRPGRKVCRACESRAAVAWAKLNREKKRAANNAYHSKISAKRADKTRAYRERNPLKKLAHQTVQTALRNGSLIRYGCSICGAKAHAHHEHYTKPLEVVWLCHKHHMERHAMLAERSKP